MNLETKIIYGKKYQKVIGGECADCDLVDTEGCQSLETRGCLHGNFIFKEYVEGEPQQHVNVIIHNSNVPNRFPEVKKNHKIEFTSGG